MPDRIDSGASERGPNRLAAETSPYLQQHARNPVDWYPWGDEALELSRREDRPIFLSIGYSSCHWCHVMERESFEDANIAELMNRHFVNIKVDREERPDLDAIYMSAVQMLTGSGGWPMSVFLTPELKPFWGGTYFPPRAVYGRPGFADILQELARVFRESRAKVEEAAAEITENLVKGESFAAAADLPGIGAIDEAVRHAKRSFDPRHGGFGPAPKFPRSVEISMLLRAHARGGDADVLAACETTLERMATGGLCDQIGGGFHRYSTDERWLVPHFEKMLYDNALLVRAYLEAYQVTSKPFYADVVTRVLDYVLREMTAPEGGFFSATDADSEGEEGKFFVWTPAQVAEVLGADAAKLVCEYFNITESGNFEHGTSIPHVTRSVAELASATGREASELESALADARRRLYAAREHREKPFRDEKIITSWNALMISAFARAYQVLEDERYLVAAVRAAGFILDHLVVEEQLHRTFKDGQARNPAYLDDHACLVEAFLDLYEATFDSSYVSAACRYADGMLRDFGDREQGGFFFTAAYHDSLICRRKDHFDNATPAAGAVAALDLVRLARLTGEKRYRETAEGLFRSVKPLLERAPMAFGYTLVALDAYLYPSVEVAVVGPADDARTIALLRAVRRTFLPARTVAGSAGSVTADLAKLVPLLEGKRPVDGKPAAYVCRDFACEAPRTDAETLTADLEGASSR